MLPTEDKTHIVTRNSDNTLIYHNNLVSNKEFVHLKGQHLYITSDDEIKEGDYYLELFGGKWKLYKQSKDKLCYSSARKIIATTDESLNFKNSGNQHPYNLNLPQIPQSFIEKYCELGGINEVLVEYEGGLLW